MNYPPDVERWRPVVAKYFPPHLVDKALWVIMHESGGNPAAVGDGGAARGLFQVQDRRAFPNRPDAAWLDNPENNIKYAAESLGAAGGNFSAWGENNLYNGQPFGALGNHPYPGGANMSIPADGGGGGSSSDGRYLGLDNRWHDKYGNTWDEATGLWRDDNGDVWIGDTGPYGGSFADSSNYPSVSGGGSGVQDRPFYWDSLTPAQKQAYVDGEVTGVSPYQQDKDTRDFDYRTAQDKIDQANKDRAFALAVGDQALAKKAQDDANYWAGVQANIDRDRNSITARGQDVDYATAIARINQDKYDSDQRYMVGMANATNDAERNQIAATWNAEQAAIALMEDETKRVLGGQQNQISQFSAETDRAARMGNLALDNNKFIREMSTSPRDLFSLYFMQRAMAPDWDTITAGGTPAMGAALVPADVMGAYKPVTAPVDFSQGSTPANAAAGNVGKATGSYTPKANPFIQPVSSIPAPAAPAAPAPWTPSAAPGPMPAAPKAETPYAGVRSSDVAGLSEWTGQTGLLGPSKVSDYTANGWKVYGAGGGELTDPNLDIAGGSTITVRRFAGGGYTSAPYFMAGDAPHTNPSAGGARPEIIENPTGAPIRVRPNPKTVAAYGGWKPSVSRPAQPQTGGYLPMTEQAMPQQQAPLPAQMTGRAAYPSGPAFGALQPQDRPSPVPYSIPRPRGGPNMAAAYGMPAYEGPHLQRSSPYDALTGPFSVQSMNDPSYGNSLVQWGTPAIEDAAKAAAYQLPRFAFGTDNSAAYNAQGMGSAWVNSSDNAHLAGMALPDRLKALAAYGAPIAPSLAAGSTGRVIGQANVGAAYGARGGGTLASMQGLGRMTPGEQELYRGYAEGVVGVPWADLVDYISRGTQNLRTAARSN